ncbi:hypothetical protein OSTOST_06414 [Ostertagia ostertagi]
MLHESFSKWFSRYKEVFSEDAKQLTEVNKVRLLCEKLDSLTFEKYQRHCLKLEKSDAEDYLTYTGRVNEFCEKVKIHELDSDGIQR